MNDTELDTGAVPGAELHSLMDRALAELPVPAHRIHDGSLRRGRTVRRRRRLGTTAGVLAATVVAAGVAWPSVAGDRGADDRLAHDPGPASTASGAPRPAGWWNMPGAVMRDRLARLLPAGLEIADANLGGEELGPGDQPVGGWVSVDLVDDDDRPAGGVNVVLYPPAADDDRFTRDQTACPGNLEAPDACTELRGADGSVVGRSSRWSAGGVVVLEVTRLTAEGAVVYAASSNSSDPKWGLDSSIDRSSPALRLDDLRAIVVAPSWRAWVD